MLCVLEGGGPRKESTEENTQNASMLRDSDRELLERNRRFGIAVLVVVDLPMMMILLEVKVNSMW